MIYKMFLYDGEISNAIIIIKFIINNRFTFWFQ